MDSHIATSTEADKAPRKKLKRILLIILGIFLIIFLVILYSIYCFYRDVNDDSMMDEIRAEMNASSSVNSTRSNEAVPILESERKQEQVQLAGNPLIDFLGMKEEEIKARFGEPEETGFWKGADYYSYSSDQDMLVFFAEDLPGVVVGLSYFGLEEIMGTRVGMSMEEIKSVLGPPDYEGYDESYTPPEYSYYYQFQGMGIPGDSGRNDLEIIFNSSSEHGPVNYIDIFCKQLL